MATDFRSVVKIMVYSTLLAGVSGAGVLDHVPFEPEGQPDNLFPYLTVGDSDVVPFDNDSHVGAYVDTTVHVWSRYKGRKEVDGLLDQTYALLHRATLTRAGYNVVDSLFVSSGVVPDPDGVTHHGFITFRITIQEA